MRMRRAVEGSLRRLVKTIDLARRTAPQIPEETVWAVAELAREGKARCLGLSECTAEELRRAAITALTGRTIWLLARRGDMIPIPGTDRRRYLEETAAAVDLKLTERDLAEIEAILRRYPSVGQRYAAKEQGFIKK